MVDEVDGTTDKFLRLAAWMDSQLRSALEGKNLTTAQFEVLEYVNRCGTVENDHLVKTTCYDRSTLSRMLSKLCRAGLIELRAFGNVDARCRTVVITGQGKDTVEKVQLVLATSVTMLLQRLPATARSRLLKGLREIEKGTGTTRFEGVPGLALPWRLPRMYSGQEAGTKSHYGAKR
jgi:DNA-binding MarR family transcriptional regulator